MERIEFVRSRMKNAGRVLLGLLLVAVSYFMAIGGDDLIERAVGWFATLFFGAATLVGVAQVIRAGTVFAFESTGIADLANSIVIRWDELKECEVVSVHGTQFLALTFRAPDEFLKRIGVGKRIVARLDERMGCGQWALSFVGVSPGIDVALEFIRMHAPAVRVR